MGLAILILGLVIFLGGHAFVTFRGSREKLIAQLGGNGYRVAFAIVALIGLVLIIYGYGHYRAEGVIPIWSPPAFMRHITVLLMFFAVIFMTAAFIPSHIRMWLKHPMLNSVKAWGLAHLLVNGDLGSIVLFGSFLAWASYARVAAKRRGDRGATTAPAGWINDALVIVIGIIVFLALGYAFHPIVIGVPVFGR